MGVWEGGLGGGFVGGEGDAGGVGVLGAGR